MSIQIDVSRDLDTGVTTVSLTGELDYSTGTQVRTALLKYAAECPTGLLVDLQAMGYAGAGMLSVFATASQTATKNWGVPLLLFGASDDLRRKLVVFRSFTYLYETRTDAVGGLRTFAPRWAHERLRPEPDSVKQARGLVGDACLAWKLSRLWYSARLIASELAANAIEHAGTDFDVTVTCTPIYLRIAVQDRSRNLPVVLPLPPNQPAALIERGRGLPTINDVATHWGTTPLPDGKIVWATMRTDRRTPSPSHADADTDTDASGQPNESAAPPQHEPQQ